MPRPKKTRHHEAKPTDSVALGVTGTPGDMDILRHGPAACFLGIKPQTLHKWRCQGRFKIPYIRIGSLIAYRKSDLVNFLNSRVVNG
jgi:hypothetical protein